MRVLLDATAVPADRGGVGRYVDALLPALLDEGLELLVACQPRDAELLATAAPGATVLPVEAVRRGRAARLAWEQVGLPRLCRSAGADVLHSPHYTMPWAAPVPVVVTLHDATFFSHPALHSPVKARFFRAATRRAAHRAAALVVPSRATANEVVTHVGADGRRIHVAPHGVDTMIFHPASPPEQARVAQSLGVAGGYVAFLGTLEPRKNVPALVRAWVRTSSGRPAPPALVLAGGRGWDDDVDRALAEVPEGLTVRRPGYLPLADLAPFLSGATVVAYPSLGEGFGLPVLEAMACGAAVLTTTELSLAEVGGDAVAYCGTDERAIAEALAALLDDPERRQRLGAAAQERAGTFTWAVTAQAHAEAYRAAVAAEPRTSRVRRRRSRPAPPGS